MTADKSSKFPAAETRKESTERSEHGDKRVDNFHQARLEAYGPRETTPKAEKPAYPEMDVQIPNYKGAQFPPVKVHIGPEDGKEITKHYNELVKGQDVSKFTQADIQKYQTLATADVFIDKYQKGLSQQELDFTNWMPDALKGPILASQALNDGAALGAAKSVLHKVIAEGALGDLASGTAIGLAFGKVVAKLAANINPWVRAAAVLCQAGGIGLLAHQIGDIGQRSLEGLGKAGPELQNLLTHPSKENLDKAKKIVEQQLGPPLADAGLVALGFAAASGAEKLGGKLVKPGTGKPTETPTGKPTEKPTTPAQAGEKPSTTKPSEKTEAQKPTDKQPETQEKPTPTKPLEKPTQKAVDQDAEYKTTDRISNKLEDGHTDVGSGNAMDKNGNFKSTRAGITYDKAHDQEYKKFVEGAKQHLNDWLKTHKNASTEQKLECLGKYVKDKLSSGAKDAAELNSKYLKLLNDNKGKRIPIGELIKKGIGACSEQATLLKAVADEAIPEAKLQLVRGKQGTGAGGTNHVWTETAKGEIIDPRRGVYGKPTSEAPDYTPGSKLSESQKHGSAGEQLRPGKPLEGAPDFIVENVQDNKVVVRHDVKITVPEEQLGSLKANNPNATFAKGEKIKVPNSDGKLEGGWEIKGYDKNGGLIVEKPIRTTLPKDKLYKHIPELQQLDTKFDKLSAALREVRSQALDDLYRLSEKSDKSKGKQYDEEIEGICEILDKPCTKEKLAEACKGLKTIADDLDKELSEKLQGQIKHLEDAYNEAISVCPDSMKGKLRTANDGNMENLKYEMATERQKLAQRQAAEAEERERLCPTKNKFLGEGIVDSFKTQHPKEWTSALDTYLNQIKTGNWQNANEARKAFSSGGGGNPICSAVKGKPGEPYSDYLDIRLASGARLIVGCNYLTRTFEVVNMFSKGQHDTDYMTWSNGRN